jgi:hypothetical protein
VVFAGRLDLGHRPGDAEELTGGKCEGGYEEALDDSPTLRALISRRRKRHRLSPVSLKRNYNTVKANSELTDPTRSAPPASALLRLSVATDNPQVQ